MNYKNLPYFQSFRLRTVTLGVNLIDRIDSDWSTMQGQIVQDLQQVVGAFKNALNCAYNKAVNEMGFPENFIQTRRVTVTPLDILTRPAIRYTSSKSAQINGIVEIAKAIDNTITSILGKAGVFIGGVSSLAQKGINKANKVFFDAIPEVLENTSVMNASINVATFKTGIDLESILAASKVVVEIARRASKRTKNLTSKDLAEYKDKLDMLERIHGVKPTAYWSNNARLAIFNDAPSDNPFMAGGYQGPGEPEVAINVGINGAGIIEHAIRDAIGKNSPYRISDVVTLIKEYMENAYRAAEEFKQLVIECMRQYGITDIEDKDGIVDLSIASSDDRDANGKPTNSLAYAIEQLGLSFGHHGSIAALAMVIDAIKRAGAFRVSYHGGLSGTFIPVSEDAGMADAAHAGALGFERYMAMTAVCSVGIDMFPVYWPDGVPAKDFAYQIAGIIADQTAIGVFTGKTTSVRILPVKGIKPGDWVYFIGGAGLLGSAPVWDIKADKFSPEKFVTAQGRIPAPIYSLRN